MSVFREKFGDLSDVDMTPDVVTKHYKHKAYMREYVKARRARLKAAGLCINCQKPRTESKVYCEPCKVKQNARLKLWHGLHPLTTEQAEKAKLYQREYRKRKATK